MTIDLKWLQAQFREISCLSPLSEGGQKEVFSGNHPTDGPVVIKLYYPQIEVDRIVREIKAVQTVDSPRVPTIFEVDIKNSPIGDVIWLREECIAGNSLRQVMQQKGSLDPLQVLLLGKQMLEALADAEKVRIVHRDVKPDNIMIDGCGNGWLLDFGLARHLDLESLTATSDYLGACTPGYAPPEQFRNRKSQIDGRADLFALGVTLYECLEGVNPFTDQTSNWTERLHRVETVPLPKISKTVDQKGEFSKLLWAMTRERQDHRLPSVAEALTWIQEICTEEGVG
jgi:serine/threonine protein kinase